LDVVMCEKDAHGAGTEGELLTDSLDKLPIAWSADGRTILYVSASFGFGL
jgi:hypothetical protein